MKTYVKYSLIAWLLFIAIVSWIMLSVSDTQTAVLRVTSFAIPQMILFYLNLLWLSCRFLDKKKKVLYYILLVLLVLVHTVVFAPIDLYLDHVFPIDLPHFTERPAGLIYFGRFAASLPPLVISALIWKSLMLRRQIEESLELKNKMLAAETKALKAQINPHFLFNSMNNIYSLAQLKSDKTGAAILHLSEILRFVTYESEKDRVSLDEELKQIKNFIELQFLKDDNQENVEISITEDTKNFQIAPMVLLPFIENSFKHSNFEDKTNGWIKINIALNANRLVMKIENSAVLSSGKKDGVGGVGMENVKRRLSLIYPEKHLLTIKQDLNKYSVLLDLNLG